MAYSSTAASGDPTRPDFLLNQMTQASLTFSPTTGIGTTTEPYSGTLSQYMSQLVSQQSQAANAASNVQQGQEAVGPRRCTPLSRRTRSSTSTAKMSNHFALHHADGAECPGDDDDQEMTERAAADNRSWVFDCLPSRIDHRRYVPAQTEMMNQLNTLGLELSTGQAATTYSGLASQAGLTLSLNAQLSAINGYNTAASNVGTTLSIAQLAADAARRRPDVGASGGERSEGFFARLNGADVDARFSGRLSRSDRGGAQYSGGQQLHLLRQCDGSAGSSPDQ